MTIARIKGILEELRGMRDEIQQGPLRSAFNDACDRLDVLESMLANNNMSAAPVVLHMPVVTLCPTCQRAIRTEGYVPMPSIYEDWANYSIEQAKKAIGKKKEFATISTQTDNSGHD